MEILNCSIDMIAMFMLGVGHLCLGGVLTLFLRVRKDILHIAETITPREVSTPLFSFIYTRQANAHVS